MHLCNGTPLTQVIGFRSAHRGHHFGGYYTFSLGIYSLWLFSHQEGPLYPHGHLSATKKARFAALEMKLSVCRCVWLSVCVCVCACPLCNVFISFPPLCVFVCVCGCAVSCIKYFAARIQSNCELLFICSHRVCVCICVRLQLIS